MVCKATLGVQTNLDLYCLPISPQQAHQFAEFRPKRLLRQCPPVGVKNSVNQRATLLTI